jgi:hypothetical protein
MEAGLSGVDGADVALPVAVVLIIDQGTVIIQLHLFMAKIVKEIPKNL